MKTKHLLFAILMCASLVLGFSSCSDDDDEIFNNATETVVTNPKFEDTNMKSGEIAGNLTWTKPTNITDLAGLVIYTSADGQGKDKKLGEVTADKESFTVESMSYVKYLLIVSKNHGGVEGQNFAKVEVKDVNETSVSNLKFEDTDNTPNIIKGKASWTKPVDFANISKIALYGSNNGTDKLEKLGEVEVDKESLDIETTDYYNYLIAVSIDKSGKEIESPAKIEIVDLIDYKGAGIYVLNSGKMGNNNANLAYYDFTTKTYTEKVFETVNGKSLGDTGQDIIVYGSKMYIAVHGSGVIYVTNKQGKILNTIESTTEGVKQQPRGFAAYEGKVYVTYYNGYLAKIDTTSMSIEAQIKVGRSPEYVRAANNKLYVANSGGGDYPNVDKTVSVVDVTTFTEKKKIDVVINPEKIAVDSDGDIYVISNGNYGEIPNTLQRIDAKTDNVTTIGNATWMSMCNDKLYFIYSQYAEKEQTITYHVYDAKNEKMITDNFITDGTEIIKPYSISTDPVTKYVYIGTSDYTSNGDMYIFTPTGKLVNKFDTKGINPMGAYYVVR